MAAAAVQVTPSVSGSSSEGGISSTEITIKGTNEAQHICIKLEPNEHVSANPDCLIYMTNGVRMEESESPSTILRRFVYANDAVGERGTLVLGSSTPCKMFSVRLESQGRQLLCQRGAVPAGGDASPHRPHPGRHAADTRQSDHSGRGRMCRHRSIECRAHTHQSAQLVAASRGQHRRLSVSFQSVPGR